MVRSSRGLGIDEVIGDKRQAVIDLAAKHGASNVRVVGSVARGQARPDSDVDLLMTMKDLLGREVSLIPDSAPDREFMRSVLEDAVPL